MEMRGNQDASITLDGVVDELNKLDTEHYHFKFSRRDKEHLRNRRLVSFSQRQQHKRDAQHAANRGLELAATTSIKGRNKGCSSQSGKNWVEVQHYWSWRMFGSLTTVRVARRADQILEP
eukprot:TRINITY_DN10846_c0_g1_i7.p2 TRINITY_DN10846_c0_g1~~TRINITY_DN10846_c0_g1_i7.p2  ORF type:complete len:120 (+),score=3.17 TRINITY_DN10846_c0_g1_i7:58-417(+)